MLYSKSVIILLCANNSSFCQLHRHFSVTTKRLKIKVIIIITLLADFGFIYLVITVR